MLEKARDAVMREAGIDEFAAGLAVRAVLMAVREPSKEMVCAGYGVAYENDGDGDVFPGESYTAMIDAILDGK